MQGGDAKLSGQLKRACGQLIAVFRLRDQQPRADHWCERDGAQQFWIIFDAVPLISVGPCPVKYVLAIGVALQIQRHRSNQRTTVPEQQIVRNPARIRAGAATFVQRMQKGMLQKRVSAGEPVPGLGVYVGQRCRDMDFQFCRGLLGEAAISLNGLQLLNRLRADARIIIQRELYSRPDDILAR